MRETIYMFCYGIFGIGTIGSLIFEGNWFAEREVGVLNFLTGVNVVQVQALGGWTLVKVVGGFFNALLTILTWNYPYLANEWGAMLKLLLLYPVTFGVIVGIYKLMLPVLQGLASFVRSLLPG